MNNFPNHSASATGTRTQVARVRAEYPNQLDYSGIDDTRRYVYLKTINMFMSLDMMDMLIKHVAQVHRFCHWDPKIVSGSTVHKNQICLEIIQSL